MYNINSKNYKYRESFSKFKYLKLELILLKFYPVSLKSPIEILFISDVNLLKSIDSPNF